MNCYDRMNNLVKGNLVSCPMSYPKRGIFRDEQIIADFEQKLSVMNK